MRIVFMGTAALSCASLDRLAREPRFQVVGVVTQPDRPGGRELKLQASPVKVLARQLGLPILQPARARDEKFIADLRALSADLIVVAAYGQILPPGILELPRFGCLNVHASLLPKYRGAAPIQRALLNGDAGTGVTIMKMNAGLDTGDIVAQAPAPIRPEDDSATLHDRLAQLGADLLVQTIPDYVAGKIRSQPQPAAGVSHAPKIRKADGRIDWNRPAVEIRNRLRAFTPWPGVFTLWPKVMADAGPPMASAAKGQGSDEALPSRLVKIWKADVVDGSGRPGEILSADKDGIVVACGQGALRVLELQREGGRRMSASEFLAGHGLAVGAKFI